MTTLEEKVCAIIRAKQSSMTLSQATHAAELILAAVIKHATSDEAIERAAKAAWESDGNAPVSWAGLISEPTATFRGKVVEQYRTEARATIRAALGDDVEELRSEPPK